MPLVALLCFSGLVVALVSQHVFDMQPCAWCTLQRLLYLVMGVLALFAWWWRGRHGRSRRRFSVLAGLCALTALSGLAAALYQHFVASNSQSCALSLADRIIKAPGLDEWAPWFFKATAFCHEANVPLLGVPYAVWSMGLFTLLLFLSLRGAWRAVR